MPLGTSTADQEIDTFQATGELLCITGASKPCTKVDIKNCEADKSVKEIKSE